MTLDALFKKVLSEAEIITDEARLAPYRSDWRGRYETKTACVLRPRSVASVQAIMRVASEHNIPVTPQGGNTGLCGGSIPINDNGVILALGGLSRVRDFSPEDKAVTVDAGITLAALRDYVAAKSYYFPLNLASKGTCQLGGNIACNAGGLNVLRFGPTRDLVLGLEVVLPNGDLISRLSPLHKDTAGCDTKQIWVGSEGTLGVITGATLKIYPKFEETITLWVACDTFQEILDLLFLLQYRYFNELTSFEYMSAPVLQLIKQDPSFSFGGDKPHAALVELSLMRENAALSEDLLETIADAGYEDVIIAQSENDAEKLWQARENISGAQKKYYGATLKHDIAVPISRLASFVRDADRAVKKAYSKATILLFGHLGDGSLHYNIAVSPERAGNEVYQDEDALNTIVYGEVLKVGGTIAAEHGVGQLKTKWLAKAKSSEELAIAKALKESLDPKGIMNPGKILVSEVRAK